MRDKNYSVARVEQHTKASIGKSERHIERKNESYENMNVDLSRAPMNVHYQSCGDQTYNAHLDKLVEDGSVSLRGLKKDAKVFDEMIFDVNTAYFEERGGYEYACRFYGEVFRFAQKEYGPENIVSAVMHADELNTALTEQSGHPVYHYHMHVVALPVVDKEILWTKRCKDPELVGTLSIRSVTQKSGPRKRKRMRTATHRSSNPTASCRTDFLSICGMPGLRTSSEESAAAQPSISQSRSLRSRRRQNGWIT